jgi:hypothetical protein
MYQISLYFDVRAAPDKKRILEIFFKDWVDRLCNNEVTYITVGHNRYDVGSEFDTIRLDFVNSEDAVALKLRGIPAEFRKYLEIVN